MSWFDCNFCLETTGSPISLSVNVYKNPLRVKAGTHEGACSWNMLPNHAPGAKLPRVYQRFHAKKIVAQQNFCSRVLLHWIKLVKYELGSKLQEQICRGSVLREQAPWCVPTWQNDPGACCGSVFQEQAPSCVPALKLGIYWNNDSKSLKKYK